MSAAGLRVTLIAAVTRNGVIGRAGAMPWSLPSDLAHFRAATLGKPVIMGRTTFEAIGGPLPGRPIVVLSRDPQFRPIGVATAGDPDAALNAAAAFAATTGGTEIMVAGGGAVYAALIPRADALLLTEVDLEIEGDTTFPAIDAAQWRTVERRPVRRWPADSADTAVIHWERRLPKDR